MPITRPRIMKALIRNCSIVTSMLGLIILVGIFASIKFGGPKNLYDSKTYQLHETTELLEKAKREKSELETLLESYFRDKLLSEDGRQRLILSSIEPKLDQKPSKLQSVVNEVIETNTLIPVIEYEQLQRRIRSNVAELYNYIDSGLAKISKNYASVPELDQNIDEMVQMAAEHKRSLLNDIDQLQKIDGREQWRRTEIENMSDLIQRRLRYLQNPRDCSNAKKLVCRIKQGWGYGTNKFEDIFKPMSDTCTTPEGSTYWIWGKRNNETQVVELPTIHILRSPPKQLPLAIPEDVAPRLKRLHGDPFVWWAGQFVKYVVRFQPETQEIIESSIGKLGFRKPIVGVHIRRTDKIGTEAALHSVEEYMKHVDEYYNQLEMVRNVEKRRVFIASDDFEVIDEARNKYPNYDIIGNRYAARMASLSNRHTNSSLYGIILDIHLLSRSDYLVCTFSSQVCRGAYELMQTLHLDASQLFKSLDDIYFFAGQNVHNYIAVLPHHPKNDEEIALNIGDLIEVAGNHWNGFSKGRNTRTDRIGLYPSFKVVDKIETVKFPKYSNVN